MGIGISLLVVVLFHGLLKSVKNNRSLPIIQQGEDNDTGLPLSWYNGDCGNSPAEANSRKCQYSITLQAWLPPNCLTEDDMADEELMYKDRGWRYIDNRKVNISLHELRGGMFEHFIVAPEWHVVHCMYVWKRLHRAMLDPNRKVDSYTANYHHTTHCAEMISGDSGHSMGEYTKVFVKYPTCA